MKIPFFEFVKINLLLEQPGTSIRQSGLAPGHCLHFERPDIEVLKTIFFAPEGVFVEPTLVSGGEGDSDDFSSVYNRL